ncbi:hypothetical protein [Bradyrhizobium sp. BR13661]|nr:hypothetical protein [Bradyrhizobium sp. BR13661]MDH6256273.1 hypothetical protein [Bradyrhizobium sp. BR13661]
MSVLLGSSPKFGAFTIGGIGTATFVAIMLYQILTSPIVRRAE